MDEIIKKLGNIVRNNLAQPLGIDHAVMEYAGNPVLFIHLPEHLDKPVHLKDGDVFDSYKGSKRGQIYFSPSFLSIMEVNIIKINLSPFPGRMHVVRVSVNLH